MDWKFLKEIIKEYVFPTIVGLIIAAIIIFILMQEIIAIIIVLCIVVWFGGMMCYGIGFLTLGIIKILREERRYRQEMAKKNEISIFNR